MLNPLNFITKFIKSSNQKELDKIENIVKKVNLFGKRTSLKVGNQNVFKVSS